MSDNIQITNGPVGIVIKGPLVAFTIKDLRSHDWPNIRRSLVENAADLIDLDIDKAIKMLEENV